MKKFLICLSAFAVVLMSSCSKDTNKSETETIPTSSAKINVTAPSTKTDMSSMKSAYKRGDAPSFIKAIEITVDSKDFPDATFANIREYFDFTAPDATAPGEDIIINGIALGQNDFSAQGYCYAEAGNHMDRLMEAVSSDVTDVKQRANKYGIVCNEMHKVYADFNGTKLFKKIFADPEENTTNINLSTQGKRANIVVENSSESLYTLKVKITDTPDPDDTYILPEDGNKKLIGKGMQVAFVVNDEAVLDLDKVYIQLEYVNPSSMAVFKTETIEVPVTAGKITNYLAWVQKDDCWTGSSNFNITWTPMGVTDLGTIIE